MAYLSKRTGEEVDALLNLVEQGGGGSSIFVEGEGDASAVQGIGTEAVNEAEVAIGKYNVSGEGTIFSVGNGESDTTRHNAFEVNAMPRLLSATFEMLTYTDHNDSEAEQIKLYDVVMSYLGKRVGYEEWFYVDVFQIVASYDGRGLGARFAIDVATWDANDPTKSATLNWVRDETGEWDVDAIYKGGVSRTFVEHAYVGGMPIIATPSGDPMHYAYEDAGAVWNTATGYWELNTLTDITTDEMRHIYAERMVGNNPANLDNWYMGSKQRTNICNLSNGSTFSIINAFYTSAVVVAKIGKCGIYKIQNLFNSCTQLHTVLDILNFTHITAQSNLDANSFKGCAQLQNIKIQNLKVSISFADSPRLSKESLLFIITNAAPTSAITITLNEAVKEWADEDADIQAALEAQPNITLAA